jgi:ATP-dependent Lon protease
MYYYYLTKIHIHFPEGSSKKDGPSAGMAITASLVSLAIGKGMK